MADIYSIDELIRRYNEVRNKGWVPCNRIGNDGGAGNTLEDHLGIAENNFSLPDFGEIEIKTQKMETGSLITLFHKEPKPARSVPKLLKAVGWRHNEAGLKYGLDEMSFRSTTYGNRFSVRGFIIRVENGRLEFVFDPQRVDGVAVDRTGIYPTYSEWLSDVQSRNPHYDSVFPVYYAFDELEAQLVKKLSHTFFAMCKTKKIAGRKHYQYSDAWVLKNVKAGMFRQLIQDGRIQLDFDARTRHNHGTKIRVKREYFKELFDLAEPV